MNKITDEYKGPITTGCGGVVDSATGVLSALGTTTTTALSNDARYTTGICGLCGGEVSRPQVRYSSGLQSIQRGESCDKCGAVPALPELPVLKMVKP